MSSQARMSWSESRAVLTHSLVRGDSMFWIRSSEPTVANSRFRILWTTPGSSSLAIAASASSSARVWLEEGRLDLRSDPGGASRSCIRAPGGVGASIHAAEPREQVPCGPHHDEDLHL